MRAFAGNTSSTQQARPSQAGTSARLHPGQGAVQTPAGPIQTKLAVNRPGDACEQEADLVADRIMRMSALGEQGLAVRQAPSPLIMRRPENKAGVSPDAPQIVNDVLSESGRPLDPPVRSFMEPRFGYDFSRVQIHTGGRADESARAVSATTYTVGRHIVFSEGAYRPETDAGRRLIAHELTHVGQQAAAGASLQRQPAEGAAKDAAEKPPMDLEAIFTALEQEAAKPIGPKTREKLRKWAGVYEKKLGKKVDLDVMRRSLDRLRMHGSLPDVKSAEEVEAEKFKPPVPCNEVIPYKVGTKLLVTHLLDKVLPADRIETVKNLVGEKEEEKKKAEEKKAQESKSEEGKSAEGQSGEAQKPKPPEQRDLEGIIRAHPSAVFDLIMSKDVPKSAMGVITESGPELVKATINVPAIPAKGDLPAYEAFTATMSLEFDTYMGRGYDLTFMRQSADGETKAFAINGLAISKSADGLQVSVGKDKYFRVRIAQGQDGDMQLQVFDVNLLAKTLLGIDDPLTLVNVVPTGEQPAEVKKKEEDVRAKYKAPPKADRPALVGGPGIQWTERPESLFSIGWRFTFSPDLPIVRVPLLFQLDYAPRSDFYAGVYSGGEFTIPSKVPVTLSLLGGARVGSMELPGPDGGPGPRVPVGGPTVGLGAGVQLSPAVELQLDTSLMWNVLQYSTGQGPEAIPTTGLKTQVKF